VTNTQNYGLVQFEYSVLYLVRLRLTIVIPKRSDKKLTSRLTWRLTTMSLLGATPMILLLALAHQPHSTHASCVRTCEMVQADQLGECEQNKACDCGTEAMPANSTCKSNSQYYMLNEFVPAPDGGSGGSYIYYDPCVVRLCDGVRLDCPVQYVASGVACQPSYGIFSDTCAEWKCDGQGTCTSHGRKDPNGCVCNSGTCMSSECLQCRPAATSTTTTATTTRTPTTTTTAPTATVPGNSTTTTTAAAATTTTTTTAATTQPFSSPTTATGVSSPRPCH
jgi:hypothetical protein